ncbi:hypothetical protein CEXT_706481 [Caerostris extrusa]|uniref:Uncharacterized protein n=1 Tax=Caerostris extrusa TaxID=172846 RepID=A0AAV4XP54_CAEEX|nr:hypothetical protein CEXT_706481 [Caerostris extrusa]
MRFKAKARVLVLKASGSSRVWANMRRDAAFTAPIRALKVDSKREGQAFCRNVLPPLSQNSSPRRDEEGVLPPP